MSAYIQRRIIPTYQGQIDAAQDEAAFESLAAKGGDEAAVWERQAVLYGLYERPNQAVLVRSQG